MSDLSRIKLDDFTADTMPAKQNIIRKSTPQLEWDWQEVTLSRDVNVMEIYSQEDDPNVSIILNEDKPRPCFTKGHYEKDEPTN